MCRVCALRSEAFFHNFQHCKNGNFIPILKENFCSGVYMNKNRAFKQQNISAWAVYRTKNVERAGNPAFFRTDQCLSLRKKAWFLFPGILHISQKAVRTFSDCKTILQIVLRQSVSRQIKDAFSHSFFCPAHSSMGGNIRLKFQFNYSNIKQHQDAFHC